MTGLLINPTNPNVETMTKDVTAAAVTFGVQLDIVHASDSRDIEAAFVTLVQNRVGALALCHLESDSC